MGFTQKFDQNSSVEPDVKGPRQRIYQMGASYAQKHDALEMAILDAVVKVIRRNIPHIEEAVNKKYAQLPNNEGLPLNRKFDALKHKLNSQKKQESLKKKMNRIFNILDFYTQITKIAPLQNPPLNVMQLSEARRIARIWSNALELTQSNTANLRGIFELNTETPSPSEEVVYGQWDTSCEQ